MKSGVVYGILGVAAAGIVGMTIFMSGNIISNVQKPKAANVSASIGVKQDAPQATGVTDTTNDGSEYTTVGATESTTGTVAAEHGVNANTNTKKSIGTEIDTQSMSDEFKSNLKLIDRSKQEVVYIIQSGDTLSYISGQVGYSVDELAFYNKIDDKNLIYANSALRLPQQNDLK